MSNDLKVSSDGKNIQLTNDKNVAKGSKLLIQHYVNNKTSDFNKLILMNSPSLLSFIDKELSITWNSPLKENNYKEYRNEFLEQFNQWTDKRSELEKYWARKGPQWDGIATIEGKGNQKGLLLVEAKAHVNEMKSKIKAVDSDSKSLIETTLKEVMEKLQSNASLDVWLNHYYQLTNRLAYLYIMNEKLGIPTWLVLCNFVEDTTHISTDLNKWINNYQEIYSKMDIDNTSSLLFNRIITIYPDGRCL